MRNFPCWYFCVTDRLLILFFVLAHTACVSLIQKRSVEVTGINFFTGPVEQAENKIAEEGTDVEVYCNVTGNSDSAVIWRNVKTGEIIEGNPLNITNITRAQAGEYKCTAINTCGVDSTTVNIDVQCKKITWSYYNICHKLHTTYYILYTIFYISYILYTMYHIPYTIYHTPYTIYYILYTIYCKLCTIYYIPYNIYKLLTSIHSCSLSLRSHKLNTNDDKL